MAIETNETETDTFEEASVIGITPEGASEGSDGILKNLKKQLAKQPRKRKSTKSSLESLTELQNKRTEMEQLKVNLEEKRLKVEETVNVQTLELQKQHLELEKEKIASKDRMYRLSLEKDERVAKYEI